MEKITIIILAYLFLSIQPDSTFRDYNLNSQCSDEKISKAINLELVMKSI